MNNAKNNTKANTELKELLICPICGKEFEYTGDTKYIISGGYTCSWKCFFNEAKRRDDEREKSSKYKSNKKK